MALVDHDQPKLSEWHRGRVSTFTNIEAREDDSTDEKPCRHLVFRLRVLVRDQLAAQRVDRRHESLHPMAQLQSIHPLAHIRLLCLARQLALQLAEDV